MDGQRVHAWKVRRYALFNTALNTFYFRLYGDDLTENPLLPAAKHISCAPSPQTGQYIPCITPLHCITLVMELEQDIVQWVHKEELI